MGRITKLQNDIAHLQGLLRNQNRAEAKHKKEISERDNKIKELTEQNSQYANAEALLSKEVMELRAAVAVPR